MLKPSRRGFLKALAAAPVVAVVPLPKAAAAPVVVTPTLPVATSGFVAVYSTLCSSVLTWTSPDGHWGTFGGSSTLACLSKGYLNGS